jgi:hypothetical protein
LLSDICIVERVSTTDIDNKNKRKNAMKYLFVLLVAAALTANAQEGPRGPRGPRPQDGPPKEQREGPPRPKLTEEQKKQRDAIIAKYDTNKDGKLDREERTKVSDDDRKLMRSFGPPPGGPRKDGPPPAKKHAA